jgi:hypothetical protein
MLRETPIRKYAPACMKGLFLNYMTELQIGLVEEISEENYSFLKLLQFA